ncbi:hypothetical protein HDU76_012977 [Blyttiomyces sp. JEL0837]|nr:hypothetical protein HDU76_012977 [Blyttiomyces sp. JEL0837]
MIKVLGPFAIGSRELGADPLSAFGGFESIPYSEKTRFPSELVDGGYVKWSRIFTNPDQSVGPVPYENVRWEFNREPFGWSSLHHASYFRGKFQIPESKVYLINFNSVVSFKIDDMAYVGNVYGYDHASASAIFLEKGEHTIYICAVYDIRVFGGSIPPKLKFSGSIIPVEINGSNQGVIVFQNDAIVPEVVNEKLVTPYISVTVMNTRVGLEFGRRERDRRQANVADEIAEFGWVQIMDVRALSDDGVKLVADIPTLFNLKLAPGQVFPLPIEIAVVPSYGSIPHTIKIELDLVNLDTLETFTVHAGSYDIKRRKWGDVYKITFLDYDLTVHYAMARPPRLGCSNKGEKNCPVVLALHGAGVEASLEFWTNAYKQQDYAWTLFPTGRTPWGFDWHGPSFKNVESALLALSHLHGVPPEHALEVGLDEKKILITGHSNGGQGAWWMTSHYPDMALAAIPASGYMKIEFYIPYYLRVGYAHTDPMLKGILESSIAENDIDLYTANMAGIPIMARTGEIDDNVPPLHTRRMVRLVNEWNNNPESVEFSEVPRQGHWFAGVLDDDMAQSFLSKYQDLIKNPGLKLPPLPEAFIVSTVNPGSSGSRGGIKILQLEVPYRLATITVTRKGTKWILKTTNVRRFGFVKDDRVNIKSWSVDGVTFKEPPKIGPSYLRKDGAEWKMESDLLWISEERYSSTYGPASQILNHPFLIVIPSNPARIDIKVYRAAARHLATSWYIYGRGSTQIVQDVDVRDGIAAKYHLIILGGPLDNIFTKRREGEGGATMVTFNKSGGFQVGGKTYDSDGNGILFLAPSPTRTLLGLVVAGTDEAGFLRALWSVPFRTGLTVPDFMVVGDEFGDPAAGWTAGDFSGVGGVVESENEEEWSGKIVGTKGSGGVLAAGFWSNLWEFDHRCGYTK